MSLKYQTRYSEQFSGKKLYNARLYNRIGSILFEYDLNNPNNGETLNKQRKLLKKVANFYNAKIYFASIKQSNLVNRGVEYVVRQIDKIVKHFKSHNIYRIMLPSISSILGPYLNGEFHKDVKFSIREPKLIASVNNSGTTEVENNSNVWRFETISSACDPLGEINKKFYTQNLGVNGKVLILYDGTPNGVDEIFSLQLLNTLQQFVEPSTRVDRFALTPNGSNSFTNWNDAALLVAALPLGSILVIQSNQLVPGIVFLADSGSSALFTNSNVETYVADNFILAGVAPPVRFDYSITASNFLATRPNYLSKKFGFSEDLEDADKAIGLWDVKNFGITLVESCAWLATRGEFAGAEGVLKFPKPGMMNSNKYGQTRLPREIINSYRAASSLTDVTQIIGLNSLYYNFTPGNFQILYST